MFILLYIYIIILYIHDMLWVTDLKIRNWVTGRSTIDHSFFIQNHTINYFSHFAIGNGPLFRLTDDLAMKNPEILLKMVIYIYIFQSSCWTTYSASVQSTVGSSGSSGPHNWGPSLASRTIKASIHGRQRVSWDIMRPCQPEDSWTWLKFMFKCWSKVQFQAENKLSRILSQSSNSTASASHWSAPNSR
jgi:hypothetical protein